MVSRPRRDSHLPGPFPCELERHCHLPSFCCKYNFINLLTQEAVEENLTKTQDGDRLIVDFYTPKTFTVHSSLYPDLNNISFALFAQYKQMKNNNGTIIWKGLPNRHAHYELFLKSKQHHVRLFYNSESAEQFPICEVEELLADDKKWHTILVVFDRELRSLKVYIDAKDISATCRDESHNTSLGTPLVDDPTVSDFPYWHDVIIIETPYSIVNDCNDLFMGLFTRE